MNRIIDDGKNVQLEILRAARDTDGASLEMRATYRPGSAPPPAHSHPEQEEIFEIQKGAILFWMNGTERVVSAGEKLVVPARTVHWAKNASASEEAVTSWIVRPALRSEEFFASVYDWSKTGGGLLRMSLIAREFRREWALAKPPRVVQTCVFGLLAPVARAMGKQV